MLCFHSHGWLRMLRNLVKCSSNLGLFPLWHGKKWKNSHFFSPDSDCKGNMGLPFCTLDNRYFTYSTVQMLLNSPLFVNLKSLLIMCPSWLFSKLSGLCMSLYCQKEEYPAVKEKCTHCCPQLSVCCRKLSSREKKVCGSELKYRTSGSDFGLSSVIT